MPSLAESGNVARHEDPSGDFMRRAYELNGEPLRLQEAGQRWAAAILSHEYRLGPYASALVLGATPWLTALVRGTGGRTVVADRSAAMLGLCASALRPASNRCRCGDVQFLQGDWMALPQTVCDLQLVAGDNSFSFLQHPDGWQRLLDTLADRMTGNAVLFCRVLAVPARHRRLCPSAIVSHALARGAQVNFTAVRVALLFAHWDAATWTIRPEDALRTFTDRRVEFDPLLCDVPDASRNDLLSIEKYRGTGVTYFVPPLAEAIEFFGRRFHVRAVHFGPYEMSQYFPLIVASKEET